MKKTKGFNHGTRNLFKKSSRERGIRSLRYLLEPYAEGQKVNIILDSAVANGRPHRRYHANTGTIIRQQGQAYVVKIRKGATSATVIARPEHLRLAQ